mmetsp:Transcript_46037/g.99979  ORF Transcript_46037/g.99979 Transcript_46037/m.99979 type:complete len:718 (+) Transcript_46037:39-2192(+)
MFLPCSCLPCWRFWHAKPAAKDSRRNLLRVPTGVLAFRARSLDSQAYTPKTRGPQDARQRKIIYLVRHAEAWHNVEEKAAETKALLSGGDAKAANLARRRALANPVFLDAPLSEIGTKQVMLTADHFANLLKGTHYQPPELVLVSPLERALQTATLLFPNHPRILAKEILREKRTGLPCDERKAVWELANNFPQVDFEDISKADVASGGGSWDFQAHLLETNADVAIRAKCALEKIYAESATSIAVVTHKGFLRELQTGPWARLLESNGQELPAVFKNAEVRVCEVEWIGDGEPRVHERLLQDATWRPLMTVEELSSPQASAYKRSTSWPKWEAFNTWPHCMSVGVSSEAAEGDAVEAAWKAMQDQLDGVCDFALVFGDSNLNGEAVAASLNKIRGTACVAGGSSSHGVLTSKGPGRLGVLGFRNMARHIHVGQASGAAGPGARVAGATAARAAVRRTMSSKSPDLLLLSVAPGCEDDVLQGIRDVCGDVPVLGGSSADNSVRDHYRPGSGWQLHGGPDGCGVLSDGVVIAAIWLAWDSHAACFLSQCYAEASNEGMITKADGRLLIEIDHRPAAEVLSEWSGFAFRPLVPYKLALEENGAVRIVQAKRILPNGVVECFGTVDLTRVTLMRAKASDTSGAAAELASKARQSVCFPVEGAAVFSSAVAMADLPDMTVLQHVLSRELPIFMCCFTLGQQGMHHGVALHDNSMTNIVVFG